MKIRDIMTDNAVHCSMTDHLDAVVKKMWCHDLGALPVITQDNILKAIITDRDICMATFLMQQSTRNIQVKQIAPSVVVKWSPDYDVKHALRLMKRHQVRRIPVVDEEGQLEGMVSMADIAAILAPPNTDIVQLSCFDFLSVYSEITRPNPERQILSAWTS